MQSFSGQDATADPTRLFPPRLPLPIPSLSLFYNSTLKDYILVGFCLELHRPKMVHSRHLHRLHITWERLNPFPRTPSAYAFAT